MLKYERKHKRTHPNRSFNINDSRKYRSLQSGGEKLRVQTKDSV